MRGGHRVEATDMGLIPAVQPAASLYSQNMCEIVFPVPWEAATAVTVCDVP